MKVIINDTIFKAKVCTSPETIQSGMMKKRFNDSFNSMLFLFQERDNQSFWTYNCIIPLDILIIDGDLISKIHHNCPPCENEYDCVSYKGFGDKVLELEGGTCKELNIQEGDTIKISLY